MDIFVKDIYIHSLMQGYNTEIAQWCRCVSPSLRSPKPSFGHIHFAETIGSFSEVRLFTLRAICAHALSLPGRASFARGQSGT
jgi:hypothetical protein